MNQISIIKKGITDFTADCIVNAANEGLWEGGGVCGAIFRAAGSAELNKACKAIGHCDTGNAVITPAFNLNAKYIIHAVGPVYKDGKHGEPKQLYDCYRNSLKLAMMNDCRSIVFPLISAGIFGYPVEDAWNRAIQACVDFQMENEAYDLQIYFAVLNDNILKIGNDTIDKINGTYQKTQSCESIAAKADAIGKKATAGDRIAVFQDTMQWCESNRKLADSIVAAKAKTEVFYENDYPLFDGNAVQKQTVTVTRERSYQAAMRLAKENPAAKIAVLNFANAFCPGGGVLKGASAQEKSLCRCSTLYPLLYRRSLKSSFYDYHKNLNSSRATDTMIYTEGVVICKTDTDFPERLPEEDWVTVDVMTLAAPDLRTKSNKYAALAGGNPYMNNAELFGYHVKRAIHMLTVAASKGADTLVLGAFGCGAFENDPKVVAHAYKCAIDEFPKVFQQIVFAIYSKNYDKQDNYTVFAEELLK